MVWQALRSEGSQQTRWQPSAERASSNGWMPDCGNRAERTADSIEVGLLCSFLSNFIIL